MKEKLSVRPFDDFFAAAAAATQFPPFFLSFFLLPSGQAAAQSGKGHPKDPGEEEGIAGDRARRRP